MPAYPSILQAIWLLIVTLFLIVVLSGIISAGAVLTGLPPNHPAAIALVNLIGIGLVLAWGIRKTRAPAADVLPLGPLPGPVLFPLTVTIIGLAVLLSEADNLVRTVLPMPPEIAEFFAQISGAGTDKWGSVLVLVIVAPLTEESLFRGLILRGFLRRYSIWTAIAVSALLFGVFHLNPWQFLGAFVLGALFAWAFVRTRSLLLCMFGHALANSLPLIVSSVLDLEITGFTTGFSGPAFQPLWFDALGAVLTAAGVWLLVRAFDREALRGQ